MTKPQTSRTMANVGRRLKALRLEARPRHTQAAVGMALGKSQDMISLFEKGGQLPTDGQLRKMLDLYGVDQATRIDLMAEIRGARESEAVWWAEYVADLPRSLVKLIEYEDSASQISIATGSLIPWPFQTLEYMRGVDEFAAHEVGVERLAVQHEVRARRQEIITRAERPASIDVLFSEAAIRPQVGGPEVMREQLARIVEIAQLPNVRLRVLPFSAGAAAATQLFLNIMDYPNPKDPGVAAIDTGTGVVFAEDPKEVRARRRMFDYLVRNALDPDDSVGLISAALKEL
ncbi:helix-turn-helix domain-containing protein [Kitasatospora sp. NPDC091335]|uniref:helix-turn-helix domain-containing protein n=1 Tax=Kitasatospora sp. NPDC091335 TaxID=3364085 RepID=UPI003800047D